MAEALCEGHDDIVVMEEYCYSGTIRAYDGLGIEMVGVPVDGRGMRTDALAPTLERLRREGRAPALHLRARQLPEPHRSRHAARAPPRSAAHRPRAPLHRRGGQLLRRHPLRRREGPALYALDEGRGRCTCARCRRSSRRGCGWDISLLPRPSCSTGSSIAGSTRARTPSPPRSRPSTSRAASGSTARWPTGRSRRSATRCSRHSSPSSGTPARGRARRRTIHLGRLPDGTDLARLEAIAAEARVSFSLGSEFHVEGRGALEGQDTRRPDREETARVWAGVPPSHPRSSSAVSHRDGHGALAMTRRATRDCGMSRVDTLHSSGPRIPVDVTWRPDLTSMKIPAAALGGRGRDLRCPERIGDDVYDARFRLKLPGHPEEGRGPRKHGMVHRTPASRPPRSRTRSRPRGS